MERISLNKSDIFKSIILSGLVGKGYTLAKETNCIATPIYLFYNSSIETIAIYNCRLKIDEFVLVEYRLPGKVKFIIDEYKNFNDPCHLEIATILETILDGSFFRENREVTYL